MVFLVDSSGSIGEANFDKLLGFIKKVIKTINVNQSSSNAVKVGLLTYSDNVVPRLYLNHAYDTLMKLVNAIPVEFTGKLALGWFVEFISLSKRGSYHNDMKT